MPGARLGDGLRDRRSVRRRDRAEALDRDGAGGRGRTARARRPSPTARAALSAHGSQTPVNHAAILRVRAGRRSSRDRPTRPGATSTTRGRDVEGRLPRAAGDVGLQAGAVELARALRVEQGGERRRVGLRHGPRGAGAVGEEDAVRAARRRAARCGRRRRCRRAPPRPRRRRSAPRARRRGPARARSPPPGRGTPASRPARARPPPRPAGSRACRWSSSAPACDGQRALVLGRRVAEVEALDAHAAPLAAEHRRRRRGRPPRGAPRRPPPRRRPPGSPRRARSAMVVVARMQSTTMATSAGAGSRGVRATWMRCIDRP